MGEVWVIDDDQSIRWVLERALGRAGFTVEGFDGGTGVHSRLRSREPDAIISDIRMPDVDGLELLGEITTRYPHLPVVIMTGYSDLDSAVSAYQGGAYEYLPKGDYKVDLTRCPAAATVDPSSPRAYPMTTSEQQDIKGQTVEQLSEARRRLACLKAKAERIKNGLRHEAHAITEAIGHAHGNAPRVSLGLDEWPSKSDITVLLGEIRDTSAEIESFTQRLREWGAID